MLLTCTHCEGFVPTNVPTCPHCGAESLDVKANSSSNIWGFGSPAAPFAPNPKLGGLVKAVASAATGGLVAATLMACYGGPPGPDFDHDGYEAGWDCNDGDATINPGAPDPAGDGIDQNCDGVDGAADAGTGGSGGAGGSDGGMCVTCNEAVMSGGLTPPTSPFCTAHGAEAFDALMLCVCTASCAEDCGDNICKGTAATAGCSTCVQTNCSTQNIDCSDN